MVVQTIGQIRIDNGNDVLQFIGGTPAASFDGAQIQRTVNLAGVTAATLSYLDCRNRTGCERRLDHSVLLP